MITAIQNNQTSLNSLAGKYKKDCSPSFGTSFNYKLSGKAIETVNELRGSSDWQFDGILNAITKVLDEAKTIFKTDGIDAKCQLDITDIRKANPHNQESKPCLFGNLTVDYKNRKKDEGCALFSETGVREGFKFDPKNISEVHMRAIKTIEELPHLDADNIAAEELLSHQ